MSLPRTVAALAAGLTLATAALAQQPTLNIYSARRVKTRNRRGPARPILPR